MSTTSPINDSTCTFRKLPPEIREKCFLPVLEWHGKSPALLVALRGDKELYEEALELFYKKPNVYHLSEVNRWKFAGMSVKALASIKDVKIFLKMVAVERKNGERLTPLLMPTQNHLIGQRTLQTLHFEYFRDPPSNSFIILWMIYRSFPNYLSSWSAALTKVTLKQPKVQVGRAYPASLEEEYCKMMNKANQALGVKGKLVTVNTGNDGWTLADEWFWEAEKGGKLLNVQEK